MGEREGGEGVNSMNAGSAVLGLGHGLASNPLFSQIEIC